MEARAPRACSVVATDTSTCLMMVQGAGCQSPECGRGREGVGEDSSQRTARRGARAPEERVVEGRPQSEADLR